MLLQGCAFLPWQISAGLNVVDIISATSTNKTLTEHVISNATGMDCQWYRLMDGREVCMTEEEELAYLKDKKCKVSAWNVLAIPYCKELLLPIQNPMLPKKVDIPE